MSIPLVQRHRYMTATTPNQTLQAGQNLHPFSYCTSNNPTFGSDPVFNRRSISEILLRPQRRAILSGPSRQGVLRAAVSQPLYGRSAQTYVPTMWCIAAELQMSGEVAQGGMYPCTFLFLQGLDLETAAKSRKIERLILNQKILCGS